MDLDVLLFFTPACFALNLAPGPNNLLSVNNAANHGFVKACLAGLGRLFAFLIMISLASAGLAAVILTSDVIFSWIKAAGAVYLFYLAYKIWRSGPGDSMSLNGSAKVGLLSLMSREFLVAAGNPKAILIFTAFLPQFVSTHAPMANQFFWLGGIFLVLEWIAIAIYAFLGLNLQRWFSSNKSRLYINRGCGSLLAAAGVALLVSKRASA